MSSDDTNPADAARALALQALVWVLQEPERADRFLGLTGLDAAAIRSRIEDPALFDAVIDFLAGHEPDLVACAAALESTPIAVLGARASLFR